MGLMGFVSKLSSVICHFSPVVSIFLSGNNMALSGNNMALSGDKMALSGTTKILRFLMKKVAEIFGGLKNILYLCSVIKELITRRD